jgi:hypothetical protein
VIDGLLGGADLDNDRVISFHELSAFVKSAVVEDSRSPTGQDPQSGTLAGEGENVFVLPAALPPALAARTPPRPPPRTVPGLSRFVDRGDGSVLDTRTGLLWTKSANPMGQGLDWESAKAALRSLDVAGRTDWRLPSKEELESMLGDNSRANYFQGLRDRYWSGSEYGSDGAYAVDLPSRSTTVERKRERLALWPVAAER